MSFLCLLPENMFEEEQEKLLYGLNMGKTQNKLLPITLMQSFLFESTTQAKQNPDEIINFENYL